MFTTTDNSLLYGVCIKAIISIGYSSLFSTGFQRKTESLKIIAGSQTDYRLFMDTNVHLSTEKLFDS